MTNIKKIIKNTIKATALALLVGAGCGNYLKPENFENVNWIKHYNSNELIWSAYMNEAILHDQHNWTIYQKMVEKRNKNNLEYFELPDLDGDGKVGK